MKNLADVAVAIPIGLADLYGSYFWYARSLPDGELFQAPEHGTWVNRGDSVYSLNGETKASVRSPISGLALSKTTGYSIGKHGGDYLMIQPVEGFALSKNDGSFMFGEIISFVHQIESEIARLESEKARLEAMSGLGKFWATIIKGEDTNKYWALRRMEGRNSAEILAAIGKLAEAECSIHPLDFNIRS